MEHYLDVSQLAPPEPLEEILSVLPALKTGHYLRVLHRREPFPLYSLLREQGYAWLTTSDKGGTFHICIWRDADLAAGELARQALEKLPDSDHGARGGPGR